MTGRQRNDPQSVHLLYLATNRAFLFLVNRRAFGQWLPLTSAVEFPPNTIRTRKLIVSSFVRTHMMRTE